MKKLYLQYYIYSIYLQYVIQYSIQYIYNIYLYNFIYIYEIKNYKDRSMQYYDKNNNEFIYSLISLIN